MLFIEKYPELAKTCIDYDILKNKSHGSHEILSWICKKGHSFNSAIRNIPTLKTCPVCHGKQVNVGVNDIFHTNPELEQYWSPNNTLNPKKITANSTFSALWICSSCKKEYKFVVKKQKERKIKHCNKCANNLKIDFNEIEKFHYQLIKEFSVNNIITLNDACNYLQKKYLWCCEKCSNEFSSSLYMRIKRKTGCPYCSGNKVLKGLNDVATIYPELIKDFDKNNNNFYLEEITVGSAKRVWWKCNKGHMWQTFMYARVKNGVISSCPSCSISNISYNGSSGQKEIKEFLFKNNIKVSDNSKKGKILKSHEIDIFCPEQNIGIEYNGLYWHSNAKLDNFYHKRKFMECNKLGIQLLTVWEDDWVYRREIVEQMLLNKLGVSKQEKLNARSMTIINCDKTIADNFYNANHIQGTTTYSVSYGLIDNYGSLLAVMAFKRRKRNEWELVRYATNAIVRGGFSKLLKHFEIDYQPHKIISFADLMVSNGGLYEQNGFINDGYVKPTYYYIVNKRRVHKFNYRLKRFQNDPLLQYIDGYTESQLADINGLLKVYDAGKIRYVKYYK